MSFKLFQRPEAMCDYDRESLIAEIVRTAGRMKSTPLVAAYQRVIFEEAVTAHPILRGKVLAWTTPAVRDADLSVAPMLVRNRAEITKWFKKWPEYVFSLLVGLAEDGTENEAWDMAYG